MKRSKKYLTTIIAACVVIVAVTSCIEDKGNYDYIKLSEAETGYTLDAVVVQASPNSRLLIEPVITYTEGKGFGNYSFEWHLYDSWFDSIEIISSGDSPNLDIILPPSMNKSGIYDILFIAINNDTGVKFTKKYSVNVVGSMQMGWLALSQKSNGMELELIAQFNDTLTLYPNLLYLTQSGYPKEGRTPLNILTFPDVTAPDPYDMSPDRVKYSVFVLTDKGTDRLNALDYSFVEDDYNIRKISMIPDRYIPEGGLIAEKMAYRGNVRYYMYMNNNWFFASRAGLLYFFLDPINTPYGTLDYYKAAPFIVHSSDGAVIYDLDHQRFMHQTASYSALYQSKEVLSTRVLTDLEGDLYKFNDTSYDLVYMADRNQAERTPSGFAIVKYKATGTHDMLTFTHSATTVTKAGKYTIPATVDMDKIKHYVYHATEPFLYLASEDKIYSIATSTMACTDITSAVVPEGHKISLFKSLYPKNGSLFGSGTVLFTLATYNPSEPLDTSGTIAFYTADSYTGALHLAKYPAVPTADGYQVDMKWSGLGKVVDVDHKTQ